MEGEVTAVAINRIRLFYTKYVSRCNSIVLYCSWYSDLDRTPVAREMG